MNARMREAKWSKRNGWRWPARSAWLWVLVLCSLLWFAPSVQAQQPTEPGPQPWPPDSMQLLPLLLNLSAKAENLQQRLAEREKRILVLKSSLQQLEQQAQTSSEAYAILLESLRLAKLERESLQKELQATASSRAKLQEAYLALLTSFDGYKQEATSQIGDIKKERDSAVLQARVWRFVAIGGLTVTVVAVVVIVVLLKK